MLHRDLLFKTAAPLALASALASAAFFASPSARAQTFPADGAWLPLLRNGAPVADPAGDAQTGRDVVGVKMPAGSAAYFYGDAGFVYFRLRMNDTVLQTAPSNFKPYSWGCLIDTDGNFQKYELFGVVDGISGAVKLQQNTSSTNVGDPGDPAEVLLMSYPVGSHAREAPAATMTSGNADVFIDWAIARADLAAVGVGPNTPLQLVCGSSSNAQALTADLISDTGAITIGGLTTDPISCDAAGCQYACVGFGQPCAAGMGACYVTGTILCSGQTPYCSAAPPMPQPETCNGIDDDCDGSTDEDFGAGNACSVGVGACAESGTVICTGPNTSICDALASEPTTEVCNGIDDDCDGSVDEGFDVGNVCVVGIGACEASGVFICNGPNAVQCDALADEPSSETCNGIDDDCDGSTDEDFGVGNACSVGVGACAAVGSLVCADPSTTMCDALAGTPIAEICNNIDDDCDGQIDNGLGTTTCGTGICEVTIAACENGAPAMCTPGPSEIETCNGLDDDCDGVIDNGCGPECASDADCGVPVSGQVCDGGKCVPGCRGAGGNGCPYGQKCTSPDSTIGTCVDLPNECFKDADCGGLESGRVCDIPARVCVDGCRAAGGNGCPAGDRCSSNDGAIGVCSPAQDLFFTGNGVSCQAGGGGAGRVWWGFGAALLALVWRRGKRDVASRRASLRG